MPTGIFKRRPLVEIGAKYNRLTVIRLSHKDVKSQQFWLLKCDCGNKKILNITHVKNGHTKSCGCLHRETSIKLCISRIKHGMSKSVEYRAWLKMKERCYDKNNISYKYYNRQDGNIIVCDRWLNSFENFYEDMGRKPDKKSLDRINNDDNYYKENCKWSSAKEQANNRRKRKKSHWRN